MKTWKGYRYRHPDNDEGALVKPAVFILPAAKQKLDAYIQLCDLEISGLGTVRQEGQMFIVEDVLLLPQECSAASTELDDAGLAEFYTECVQADMDTGRLRLWWHSHCNFGTFWSGVDTDNIDRLMESSDWLLSIVGNKHGQFRTRLDSKVPVRLSVDELPLNILIPPDVSVRTRCKAEIATKVRERRWGGGYGWQRGWYGGEY